ncbi:MAG TPA: FtsQ-type POTRA domain-containing protein [Thermoanaerobaculia bacterium]|nr:FtsQ-type POTRA domain-containing protein [Thermoanaerobaculia bacterium]
MDSDAPFLRKVQTLGRKRKPRRIGRALLFAAFLLVSAAGLTRFLGGSLFALKRFEIAGNERTRTEEVLKALDSWRSANLVLLNLSPVAAKIQQLPWIAGVTLAKKFPDGLSIRVTERVPVALLREGSGLFLLDAMGAPIAPYDSRADRAEYVLVTGDRASLPDAVALLENLRARLPQYFSALSEISTLPDGGFGMMDSIFRKPVRVLGFDAPEKIDALLKARTLIESRRWEARAIDLRFADRIVLEGAYGAGNSL